MEFYERGYYNKKSKVKNRKLFYPNDNVKSIDDVIMRISKREGDDFESLKKNLNEFGFCDKDRVLNTIGKETLRDMFWPRQIKQIYGEDFFNDNFNWLGQ